MKQLNGYSKQDIYIAITMLVFGILWAIYLYSPLLSPVKTEIDNIMLDRYNFKQLEKIKFILSEVSRESYDFRRLAEFNKQFDTNITPIKNCYYFMSTKYFEDEEYKGNELGYIFGTKIYSKKFLKDYSDGYYTYPNYNLPIHNRCYRDLNTGEPFCYDGNLAQLEGTIERACLN